MGDKGLLTPEGGTGNSDGAGRGKTAGLVTNVDNSVMNAESMV